MRLKKAILFVSLHGWSYLYNEKGVLRKTAWTVVLCAVWIFSVKLLVENVQVIYLNELHHVLVLCKAKY